VSDQANLKRFRQAARRRRSRRRRQARRPLDAAYQAYLRDLQSDSRNHSPVETNESTPVVPQSPLHSCTPPPPEPDSPHSVLTLRVRPDTPPRTPSISPPSYSPIHFSRPTSPTNSTSSVEFIDELYIPPPRPRYYYHYNPNESLENLITQFPQRVAPVPPDSYFIGPDNFDLAQVRTAISGQDPDAIVPVFLPTSPFPYNVPVRFFFNLFPPSTIIIDELPD